LNPSATDRAARPSPGTESPASRAPIHFQGLNALRCYAAFSVVIAHTSYNFGNIRSMPAEIPWLNLFFLDAQTAANLFLVLSGFLITYLIFEEQAATGHFDARRFLIRRMIRILPLYYLTIFVGLCLVPLLMGPLPDWETQSPRDIILTLLVLPDFVTTLRPLEPIWFIGVLSQFYVLWTWAMRRPPPGFLKIIVGILIVKIAVAPVIDSFHNLSTTNLFLFLRFECPAIGALGAYIFFFKKPVLQILCSLPAKAAALGMLAVLAVWDLPLTEPAIYLSSCVFTLLLLNFFTGSSVGRKLDLPLLNRLGEMSYGIYMFHYPLLYCLLHIFKRAGIPEGPAYTALLHGSVIAGTLFLAALSFYLLERPFLRLKKRFAVLSTRA
jgi:peptidoglycan/LPS O-acetylase OafA/YrhL